MKASWVFKQLLSFTINVNAFNECQPSFQKCKPSKLLLTSTTAIDGLAMESKHTVLYLKYAFKNAGHNTSALKKGTMAVSLQHTVCRLISRTEHVPNYPYFCFLQRRVFMKENHKACHIYLQSKAHLHYCFSGRWIIYILTPPERLTFFL